MVTLAYDNPSPPLFNSERERGYSIGFGRGTIDKCSGVACRPLDRLADTDYNDGYANGYLDGYCSNDAEM